MSYLKACISLRKPSETVGNILESWENIGNLLKAPNLTLRKPSTTFGNRRKPLKTFEDRRTTFENLVCSGIEVITDTKPDEHAVEVLGLTDRQLAAMQATTGRPLTWLEVALRSAPEMTEEELDNRMADTLVYHGNLATRMATHLQLTADNVARSTW